MEIFSKYFGNIFLNFETDGVTSIFSDNDTVTVRKETEKYQNHPGIKIIQKNIDYTINFIFDVVNPKCIT